MNRVWKSIIEEWRWLVPVIEASRHVGSGLLISQNGYILTNKHVVESQSLLFVSLCDGTRIKAIPIHCHEMSDLAIVKAVLQAGKHFDLSPDRLAENCEAGDDALAIGHPRGLHWTPTTGIVSDGNRATPEGVFVQTDVAINPGNSGGPLIDRLGRLIGINTFGMRESEGLNFAIPARQAFDYWQAFCEKAHKGEITIPSDEEILKTEQAPSPVEMLHAAAELAGIEINRDENDDEKWNAYTPNGNWFWIAFGESFLWMIQHIAELDEGDLQNASLLQTMLRWQHDILAGPRFTIDEKDLFLHCSRTTEGINVQGIAEMLFAMAKAIDEYVPKLDEYFGH